MKNKKVLITDIEWFESGPLKNPIASLDHELEKYYPTLYCLNYDTKLLATDPPTKAEKEFIMYNDYREKYGTRDLSSLDSEIRRAGAKNLFLNGFNQDLFEYIVPLIKDSTEILYFFKCPQISDLSELSQFSKLKCVHIFCNDSLTKLWDMTNATNLRIISFNMVSKLNDIETLKHSFVEYVHLDGIDNNGCKKSALFNVSIFKQMPHLRYLSLDFENWEIKKTW